MNLGFAPDCKINPKVEYSLNPKHLYNGLLWTVGKWQAYV